MKMQIPEITVLENQAVATVMKQNAAAIVSYILEALEQTDIEYMDEIDIFIVKFEIGLPQTKFTLKKEKYSKFLNKMLGVLIEQEKYEFAGRVKKTMDKLGIK